MNIRLAIQKATERKAKELHEEIIAIIQKEYPSVTILKNCDDTRTIEVGIGKHHICCYSDQYDNFMFDNPTKMPRLSLQEIHILHDLFRDLHEVICFKGRFEFGFMVDYFKDHRSKLSKSFVKSMCEIGDKDENGGLRRWLKEYEKETYSSIMKDHKKVL
jgi:hypothetical protein